MARICAVATAAAAWPRAGKRRVTRGSRSRSLRVTAAPIRRPPSGRSAMPPSSGMRLTLTSTSGTDMRGPAMRSFIRPRRSVPPARTWARPPCSESAPTASSIDAASTWVKGGSSSSIGALPGREGLEDPRGGEGELVDAEAERVAERVAHRGHDPDEGSLADRLRRVGVERVLALHVAGLDDRRLERGRHPVLVHVRGQQHAGLAVHLGLLVEAVAQAHHRAAVLLRLDQLRVDRSPDVVGADDADDAQLAG